MENGIQTTPMALPEPRVPITIRPGVLSDVPFLDSLQKRHTKQVGWMPTAQFEGKIQLGHVLIVEEIGGRQSSAADAASRSDALQVGYLIGNDQYFKRDDVGIIYQMNVLPGKQRGLVAASLLKAQFERSAYGCKLYCCWCAQDIEANRFWEAMGFVPLAFLAGSRTKGKDASGKAAPRVHIFWQKRIRRGDVTTPYWYPAQTNSGAIREDRLVLPIPPGTHWSDAKPMVLPGAELPGAPALADGRAASESTMLAVKRPKRGKVKAAEAGGLGIQISSGGGAVQATAGGLRFADPTPVAPAKPEKAKRPRQPKAKNDPKYVAFARELRDRYLEQYNTGEISPGGKYDVTRQLRDDRGESVDGPRPLGFERHQRLLPAA